MFNLFKKKPKEQHFISKTIMYKGFDVLLWADKQSDHVFMNHTLLSFYYGWQAAGYGEYSSGATAEGLEEAMKSQFESAKRYIDAKIDLPEKIGKAKKALDNLF